MALLLDTDRHRLWAEFMQHESARLAPIGTTISKGEARTIVDAVDARTDAFLAGLGVPPIAKLAQLTAKQQAKLVLDNLLRRYEGL